ncbi:hypothetical protein OT109_15645 [Phycisphaeraceae bacterium D3-23]
MRVAPRANLTISLLRHQAFGTDRLLGVGPQSLLALPLALQVARTSRVDVVELSPQSMKPELLNTPHTACACPPSPAPSPSPLPGRAAEDVQSKKEDVPPPPRPNPAYEPADGGGIGLLDLLA